MPRIPPTEFKDGDALEPWHVNFILGFIRRWMKFDASAPLQFDANGESPPHLSIDESEDLVPIWLGSGIGAGSITGPTSATVTLLIDYFDGPGMTTTGADSDTLYNLSTTAVASGKFGWGRYRGPYLYLVSADC